MTSRHSTTRATTTLLAALVFVAGIEMARYQFASLGWYQRDTLGVATLDLIPLAIGPFLAGILIPLASRLLSLAATLRIGVVLLVGARLTNQIVADPEVDHWASAVAVAAFVGLLPVVAGLGRSALVGGVLLGVTIDTAIKGLGASLDLSYRSGWPASIAVAAIGAAVVYLALTARVERRAGPGWSSGLSLAGIGPLLFVQYLILQSSGWTAEVVGAGAGITSLRIVALDVVALWLAYRWGRSGVVGLVAALLVAAAVLMADASPIVFNILALVAVPATGPLWAALVPDPDRPSLAPAATWLTLGMVLFLLLGLAYYLPLDLSLGFTQSQARGAGAVLVALFGLGAGVRRRAVDEPVTRGIPALASLTLLLPAVGLLGAPELPDPPGQEPVRVMSYNIHQAFGTGGEMDVDAVADVILDSGATVVGLQEVARGGLLNAGTDLVDLLGGRLGWEHVEFYGTTDPVWGNAILSRYPLGEVERRLLPTEGTPYQRGYLAAPVATPAGELLFISTHLQHINDPAVHDRDPESDLYPVHQAQLRVVREAWAGRRPAVLVGDLNARPGWRQVEEMLDAGWVDAWAEAGEGDGYTANAADPRYRIDYVLHTDDLAVDSIRVIESQASDHFAVVADLTSP